jgi:hypothetical protein
MSYSLCAGALPVGIRVVESGQFTSSMDFFQLANSHKLDDICESHKVFGHRLLMIMTSLYQRSMYLNEVVLKSALLHVPELLGLHVVGCPQIDHLAVLRLVAYTPALESLSLTTNVRPSVASQPSPLTIFIGMSNELP